MRHPRTWVLALAYLLAGLLGPWVIAPANDSSVVQTSESPGKPPASQSDAAPPAAASPAKPLVEKRFETQLRVAVTARDPDGKDRPVEDAEVKILSPTAPSAEPRTSAAGTVTFTLTGPASVKVRVIAEGWQSALVEVNLKEGAQQVTVPLTPFANEGD